MTTLNISELKNVTEPASPNNVPASRQGNKA